MKMGPVEGLESRENWGKKSCYTVPLIKNPDRDVLRIKKEYNFRDVGIFYKF